MLNSPKIEIVDEKIADEKPNFKDIFSIGNDLSQSMSSSLDAKRRKKTREDNQQSETINEDTKLTANALDKDVNNKQTTKGGLSVGFSKYKHIIVLSLCVIAVLACLALFIYYFVSMRKSKVELLRLTSDCENYKRLADETTNRENHIISMYETEKTDLQDKITKMEQELDRLSNERKKYTQSKSIMKRQPQKHTVRSSIPNVGDDNKRIKPKVELIDDIDQDDSDETDDEFNVDVPLYDEAPATDKNNNTVSPTQQVKNMINKKANNGFKNKMMAMQKANEVEDNYENEQIEISNQLGLNKSQQINTDKLNDVVAKMEKAVDESTKDINQHAIDDDNTMYIDSLIVN